jgi:hypothetical protein
MQYSDVTALYSMEFEDQDKLSEVHLAEQVIMRAFIDAGLDIRRPTVSGSTAPSLDRLEALNFLTADRGPWKQSREAWCAIADRCPNTLRTRALFLMENPDQRPTLGRFVWSNSKKPNKTLGNIVKA